MTEVANPAVQTMLEQQSKVTEVIEELNLKTIFTVRFNSMVTSIQGEYDEIAKLEGAELEESSTHLYAELKYKVIEIAGCERKGD